LDETERKNMDDLDRGTLARLILECVEKHHGDKNAARQVFIMSMDGEAMVLRTDVLAALFNDVCNTGRWPAVTMEEQALIRAGKDALASRRGG
jgi:hypothetical protein